MAESGAPISSDQLVEFVTEAVRDHFSATGRGISGAVLAEKIRGRFPLFNPAALDLGEHWLAEIIRQAEGEGKLVRNRDVKHIEVFPPERQPPTTFAYAVTGPSTRTYVDPALWRAFVFVTEPGPSYFDRRTLRVVPASAVTDESTGDLCRIDPIPGAEQQAWMQEFVQRHESLPSQQAPIKDDYWWAKFSQWLRQFGPELEIQWRRFRTQKVVDRVRQWARVNGIDSEVILSPVRSLPHRAATPVALRTTCETPDDALVRTAVIGALQDMHLEELMNLAIPVRYMLRHFKPR